MSKFAIVAGAGISVDAPSNLPSWWKFNEALIDVVKNRAKQLCSKIDDIFGSIKLDGSFPVQTLSDVLVRNGMGDYYFPILKFLNSDRPNGNHLALSDLVKNGFVDTIITTNFDKLIELAFEERNVPINVMYKDSHFEKSITHENVLLKIHGSVDDPMSFIDTVTQKAIGLSKAKRNFLVKRLNCDIIFVGFSGADFDFDENYIPINVALENNKHIKWIVHPKSKISENVLNLKKKYPTQVEIEEKDLSSFFKEFGIAYCKIELENEKPDLDFDIKKQIEFFFESIAAESHTCLGYCLHILYKLGKYDECNHLINEYEKIIDTSVSYPLDAVNGINALACMEINHAHYEKGIKYFLLVTEIVQKMENMWNPYAKGIDEALVKKAKEENRITFARAYLNIATAYHLLNNDVVAKYYINLSRTYLKENSFNEIEMLNLLENRIDCDEELAYDEFEKNIFTFSKLGEIDRTVEIALSFVDSLIRKSNLVEAEKYISFLEKQMKNVFSDEYKTKFSILQWNYCAKKGDVLNEIFYLKQSIKSVLESKSQKLGKLILDRIRLYHAKTDELIPDLRALCKLLGYDAFFWVRARNGEFLIETDGSVVQKKRRIATHDFGL